MSSSAEPHGDAASDLEAGLGARVVAIVALALAVKLALFVRFPHGLYDDVIRAVNFGHDYLLHRGHPLITSKTAVGPVIWWALYHRCGVPGLRAFNVLAFGLACELQRRLGRPAFGGAATAIAIGLFAFYPGTNLTVVAGEQDDLVTLLLFAAGIWLHLRRDAAFGAGLLMGLALLFKLTAVIFFAGFALHLLRTRGGSRVVAAALGLALPFALLNVVDGFDSTRNLLYAVDAQLGYSTWDNVAFKLLSTGLLPAIVVAWWSYREHRGATMRLFCLVPSAYLAYVLLSRDAFSAGFVMMQGIFFAGFPIARFLLDHADAGGRLPRRVTLATVLAGYVALATAISWHNLAHDPVDLRDPHGRQVLVE